MILNNIGLFVRSVYFMSQGLISEQSDNLEELAATEAAEIALSSDANWDNEAMRRIADFFIGFGERLKAKLDAGDANHGKPA